MGINDDLPGNKRDQDPDFTDCKSSDPTNSCEICSSKDPCYSYTDIVITEKGKKPVTITVCDGAYKEIYLIRQVADTSTDDAPKFVLFDKENTFKFSAVNLDKELGKIEITMDSKCTVDSTICPTANFLELDKRKFNFFNSTFSQDLVFYDPNDGQEDGFINLNFIEPVKQLLRGSGALLLPQFLSGSFYNYFFLEAAKQHRPDHSTEFSYKDGLYSRPEDTWSQAKITVLPYFSFKANFCFFRTVYKTGENFNPRDLTKNEQQQIQREIFKNNNPDKPTDTGGATSRAQKGYKKMGTSLANSEYDVGIGGSINLYGMEFELDIEKSFKKTSKAFDKLTNNSFRGKLAKEILGRPSPQENEQKLVTFELKPGVEVELEAKLESSPDLLDYGFTWDLTVAPTLYGSMKVELVQGIIAAASSLAGPGATAVYHSLTFIREKLHHNGGGTGLQLAAHLKMELEYKAEIKLKKPYQDDFNWEFVGNKLFFTPSLFMGVSGSIETIFASGGFVASGEAKAKLNFKLAENKKTKGVELLFFHDGILIIVFANVIWSLGEFTQEEIDQLNFKAPNKSGAGMEYLIQDPIKEENAIVLIS